MFEDKTQSYNVFSESTCFNINRVVNCEVCLGRQKIYVINSHLHNYIYFLDEYNCWCVTLFIKKVKHLN